MEFILLYAASGHDYSEIYSHYKTREITHDERMEGIYGDLAITFDSLKELIRFEDEIGDIIICERCKKDNTYYKAIIIYDDYLD